MAMTKELSVQERTYSVEQYLALEEVAEAKHEYHDGKLIEMSGGTFEHNKITARIIALLSTFLIQNQKPCDVTSSDMKIWLPNVGGFVYPDVTVLCDTPIFFKERRDVLTNPTVLIEVLSKSTEAYDRGKKFELYSTLPSLQEYVLVSQYEPKIETYYRASAEQETWEYRKIAGLENEIHLQALDCTVRLADVYHSIDFEKISDEEETVEK